MAAENKVQGTPTVFVNGRRMDGGSLSREHIFTLIHETLNEEAAKNRTKRSGRVRNVPPMSNF